MSEDQKEGWTDDQIIEEIDGMIQVSEWQNWSGIEDMDDHIWSILGSYVEGYGDVGLYDIVAFSSKDLNYISLSCSGGPGVPGRSIIDVFMWSESQAEPVLDEIGGILENIPPGEVDRIYNEWNSLCNMTEEEKKEIRDLEELFTKDDDL